VELNKLITSKGSEQIREAYETGMTDIILPEFNLMMQTAQNNPHHCYSVGEHTIKALSILNQFDNDIQDDKLHSILCWSVLLHDVAKPLSKSVDDKGIDHFYGHAEKSSDMVRKILRRLKFDNYTIDMVQRLVKWHDYRFTLKPASIRKATNRIGEDIMMLLFVVKRADILAQSLYHRDEKLEEIRKAQELFTEIIKSKQCLTLKSLAVNGQDLMMAGFPSGKQLGVILNQLLEQVLEDPELNEKEQLIQLAKKIK
jgi:tRNA nucleotidyltransferase (CCA-adding enzyme)